MNAYNVAHKTYDAVIIGGGTAGATTAFRLAQRGKRVAIIERQAHAPPFKIGEGLPPTINPLLKELGLLSELEAGPHQRVYGNRSVWGSDQIQSQDFIFQPYGDGWHLDRVAFDDLLRNLAQQAGADIWWSSRLLSSHYCDNHWQLEVTTKDQQSVFEAPWVVDATGRSAIFARRMNIQRNRDDRLIAFVQRFERVDEDQDATTLIESFAQGWWYTAALPQNQRVVVMLTDDDTEAMTATRTEDGFRDLLGRTKHISTQLRDAQSQGNLSSSPAGGSRLEKFEGIGWLSVGDAAMAFDPLSSQGILTALYCADKAAQALVQALDTSQNTVPDYGGLLAQIYQAYQASYHQFYAREDRWPHEPFWQRRRFR
ncbi:MAG: FAD-dependent oxidoreductase [Chloroflexota bacterium]